MSILVKLNITIGQHALIDQFEYEINNPYNFPRDFALQMTNDLRVSASLQHLLLIPFENRNYLPIYCTSLVIHLTDDPSMIQPSKPPCYPLPCHLLSDHSRLPEVSHLICTTSTKPNWNVPRYRYRASNENRGDLSIDVAVLLHRTSSRYRQRIIRTMIVFSVIHIAPLYLKRLVCSTDLQVGEQDVLALDNAIVWMIPICRTAMTLLVSKLSARM